MPQVTCPACQAAYDIPITTLGASGRKLRCAECQTLFLATGPEEGEAQATSDAALVDSARDKAEAMKKAAPGEVVDHLPQTPRQRLPWHMRIGALPQKGSAGSAPVVIALMIAAGLAAAVGLRKSVVAAVPETAALYSALKMPVNLRGLELRAIKSGVFNENAVELLVVQGEIANVTGKKQVVPPLAFTVRDAKGAAVYSWTASADVTTLEPGGKATFRRRLASPPAEGVEVLVRFAGKPNQIALAR